MRALLLASMACVVLVAAGCADRTPERHAAGRASTAGLLAGHHTTRPAHHPSVRDIVSAFRATATWELAPHTRSYVLRWVLTTNRRGEHALDPDDSDSSEEGAAGATSCVALVAEGRFVDLLAKVPPGYPSPRGRFLSEVVERATGQPVLQGSSPSHGPSLRGLGRVHVLHVRKS